MLNLRRESECRIQSFPIDKGWCGDLKKGSPFGILKLFLPCDRVYIIAFYFQCKRVRNGQVENNIIF